jgi:capsid protein
MMRGSLPSRISYTPFGQQKLEISARSGSGYPSANTTWEGRSYVGASGDYHNGYDREQLINQHRAFERENLIYKGMIERAISYIIGTGFTLDLRTASPKYNAKAESLWKQWIGGSPEIRGVIEGDEFMAMVCSEMFAGDPAIIKLKSGYVQLIEPEQIGSLGRAYTTTDGLEFSAATGRLERINICPYVNGVADKSKAAPYDINDVIFITHPSRPSQSRTVPPAQACFPMLHRINDMCDSEAIAAQLLSRLAASVTGEGLAQKATDEAEMDDLGFGIKELDYATIFYGDEGMEIKGIERNIPGKNFESGLRMFLRLLGLPLGLPLEIILLDWTQSNYSQSRAVLDQAYKTFLRYQARLVKVYRQLFEWKVRQWTAAGLLQKRDDYTSSYWIVPAFPWIDQLKEAQACKVKIENGFGTYSEMLKSRGLDLDDTRDQLKAETIAAIKISQEIEKETGVQVSWRRFAGLSDENKPVAEGQPQQDDQTDETDTKNKKDKDDTEEDQ